MSKLSIYNYHAYLYVQSYIFLQENPCDIVVNVLDCNTIVSEFELQLCNYVLFWTNTLEKDINYFIPLLPSYGLNSTTTVLM